MVMTKKDFEAIAEIIKDRMEDGYSDKNFAREDIADDLAVYFKKDNPRFNRDKFLRACGVIE